LRGSWLAVARAERTPNFLAKAVATSNVRIVRRQLNGVVVVTAMASDGRWGNGSRRNVRRGDADVNDDWIGIDRRLVRDVVGVP
jgi:hypothetical protein